jgi:branched-chain amino acid transport system substrate-binding protein
MEESEMMRKSRIFAILLALVLVIGLAGCGGGTSAPAAPSGGGGGGGGGAAVNPDKETIVIGACRPLSGIYQLFEESVWGPLYKMWVEEVNAKGGLYIEEYGKRLPIEMIVYDEASSMDNVVRLTERLITEDKVDFLFATNSTAFLFAQAQITIQHGFLLFGAEGGSAEVSSEYQNYPLFFPTLNHSTTQLPALAKVYQEMGIKTAYITYIDDLHGLEYKNAAEKEFPAVGIEIVASKGFPIETADFTNFINEARASGADAYCQFAYPDNNFPFIFQAMAMDFNPKSMIFGPSVNMDIFPTVILEGNYDLAEGVMGFGAWNTIKNPGAQEFVDLFKKHWPEVSIDWWGHLIYYAGLEVFGQAVEKAGTLDHQKIAEVYKAATKDDPFHTFMGPVWFVNNSFAPECFPGNVGQWQGGVYQILDQTDKRTAAPIIKPAWPH